MYGGTGKGVQFEYKNIIVGVLPSPIYSGSFCIVIRVAWESQINCTTSLFITTEDGTEEGMVWDGPGKEGYRCIFCAHLATTTTTDAR